ncbi:hypothetical protein L9F63_023537 [Diploptera punctata]|uniref:Cytochrome b561 domain-containing protein n=1 Tax=Diploptera punctata TaxID=6984 RepID=A0AAD7ZJ63_DIPPU|nr:hypothetical protein L9F63_023537 [Diploptera punctata]
MASNSSDTRVVCCLLTCCGGIFTYFAVKLKDFVKPSYNKLGHTVIGVLSFTIAVVAEGTGFYTRSFSSNTSTSVQIACTVLMSLAAFIVLEGACMSVWSRIRRL